MMKKCERFKYKLEIIADSMDELMMKTEETRKSICADEDFRLRIESKGMESCFFTRYANVKIIDTEKECKKDKYFG